MSVLLSKKQRALLHELEINPNGIQIGYYYPHSVLTALSLEKLGIVRVEADNVESGRAFRGEKFNRLKKKKKKKSPQLHQTY